MALNKQARKDEYRAVMNLMLNGKNKEAFDKLSCMCGEDTGIFVIVDYDEAVAKLSKQKE